MDTTVVSTSDSDKVDLRIRYRKLLKEIEETQEELAMIENYQLMGHMIECNELFKKTNDPQTAAIDAKVVTLLAKLVRLQAEMMSTNITQFTYQEYCDRLLMCLDIEKGDGMSKMKLVCLGKRLKPCFRRSPPLTYLYGALDFKSQPKVVAKEKVRVCRQTVKHGDLVETISSQVTEMESSKDLTEVHVTNILKELVAKFKKAKRMPIDYFTFVLDPNNFGKSIENMFHVSFLVKEGKVAIEISEESGLPVLSPVATNEVDCQDSNKNQVVININMEDWFKLVNSGHHRVIDD